MVTRIQENNKRRRRESTARSQNNNTRSIFCLSFCLKTVVAFFPLNMLSTCAELIHFNDKTQLSLCCLSSLLCGTNIYAFFKSAALDRRKPNIDPFQSPLMSVENFPFMFVYFKSDLISYEHEQWTAASIVSN